MASRQYSAGSVSKHGAHWRLIVTWIEDGKQSFKTKTTSIKCYADPKNGKPDNRGRGAAENELRRWRDELIAAEKAAPEVEASSTKLYEYARTYYDLLHVKESTKFGYHSALLRLAGSNAGNARLCNLTSDLFREWEKDMYDDGLSETTVAHYHAFVAQVLKHALGEGDLARNPLANMRAPRRRPKPVNSLRPEDIPAVCEKLDALGPTPLSIGARIALMTGMRRGEVCALRWQDVDLRRGSIHVVHALTKECGFKLDTPKDPSGKDSTRTINIGPSLISKLEERKHAMRKELEDLDGGWSDSLYVLGSATNGTWKDPGVLGREWANLTSFEDWRGTQGELVRFHDLRHTFATIALASGKDVMTIAEIMGHRDATTTLNIYATTLEETKRKTMDELDAVLSGNPEPPYQEARGA